MMTADPFLDTSSNCMRQTAYSDCSEAAPAKEDSFLNHLSIAVPHVRFLIAAKPSHAHIYPDCRLTRKETHTLLTYVLRS
jgi:hypothetical protein